MSKTILVIGDTQVKPGESQEHIEHIGKYIVDKRPDIIVCIGDWFDFPSLSSYDKGKKSFEGRRLIEDLRVGHEAMEKLLTPLKRLQRNQSLYRKKVYKPRMVFTMGNHCDRYDRLANDMPELSGFVGTETLNLEQYGWEVYPFLKPVEIEGIFFVHYLANPMTGRPYSGTALAQLKTVGRSFVAGHKQCLDMAIHPTLDGKLQIGIINGACLTPDHKVLHADLTYRPLGDLKVGDELVSFDEDSFTDGKRSRRYKKGTVEAVKIEKDGVYKVTLESGKEFKVTKDHRWMIKTGTQYLWKTTDTLRKGTRVPRFLQEWETKTSFDSGWLSGIYDGEGTYHGRATSGGTVAQLVVTQRPGLVADKIVETLKTELGEETTSWHTDHSGCNNYRIKGGARNVAKVLGSLRPVRLLEKFEVEHLGRLTCPDSDLDTVISIEYLGEMDIVQTSIDAKTMIVEGYGHHNCYPFDEAYKGYQGNSHFRGIIVLHEVEDGSALPMPVSLKFLKEKYGQT